jgi:competence protein ComEC
LTHAHQDHIGGLTAIFENFNVTTLWIGHEVAWPQQVQLEALPASRAAQVIHELRGNHFHLDGAHGDFLWPQIVPEEIAPSAKNDDALVFRIKFRERSFLLPGDAEKLSEHYIPSESDAASRQSNVLKVGHHASKNSAIPEFLAAVQPRLGVITSGEDNPYRHPRPKLLERLRQAAIPTLRTGTNGAIHIITDG